MGGDIAVKSQTNKGSTFTLSLPINITKQQAA
jgi:signal transduction histidine kinase